MPFGYLNFRLIILEDFNKYSMYSDILEEFLKFFLPLHLLLSHLYLNLIIFSNLCKNYSMLDLKKDHITQIFKISF